MKTGGRASAWQWGLFAIGALLILGGYNASIWRNERVLDEGAIVRLALAPVDPRAFLTGDFMALNYALSRTIAEIDRSEFESASAGSAATEGSRLDHDRIAILSLDEDLVARLVRMQSAPTPRESGEVAVQVRMRGGGARLGTNAWYFQEGTGARFEAAKFGEFRVAPDGRMLLVKTLDAKLHPIEAIDSSRSN